jgi:NitT/TauT family transport system substrate-binding protein
MRLRWLAAVCLTALLIAPSTRVQAALPLAIGSSAGAESTPIFVAAEEGIFAKHGLDVKIALIPLMPNLPAAVLSNSVQIGFMTTTTFLQAVGGGIDFVAVSGGSVTSHQTTNIAFMAATSSGIHAPQDLVGHKVGVPGLGAFMHVTFRYWLAEKGVDWRKVDFIETTFSSMRDQLKGGTVDAVGAMDPYAKSIADSKTGYVVSQFLKEVPEGKPVALFVSQRDWATKNAETLKAFRAAYAEAVDFVHTNQDKARLDFGKYVKLPPAALLATDTGHYQPTLTPDQLQWWIDVMHDQDMLSDKLDPTKLIAQ